VWPDDLCVHLSTALILGGRMAFGDAQERGVDAVKATLVGMGQKADEGMVTVPSARPVGETMDRLQAGAIEAGLLVFARVDHADNAAESGLKLRPTQLLIFGHPRGGTPLMQERQTGGIDLPVKALAWQGEDGRVWLTCNSAEWMAERHGLGQESERAVAAIAAGMAQLAERAVAG
jgi:uncharacterized protein (DUF302 family)